MNRHELRYAARALARSPGFFVVAVLSLGLAIALNTTMFAVVDALLYPKYPFVDQDRLFQIEFTYMGRTELHPFDRLQERARFVESMTGYGWGLGGTVTVGSTTTQAGRAWSVGSDYFDVVGVKPFLGRLFTAHAGDATHTEAVISYSLWRRLNPGRETFDPFTMTIGASAWRRVGQDVTVIGVLPDRAERALGADLYIATQAGQSRDRSTAWARVLVRAKPGFDQAAIDAELRELNTFIQSGAGVRPDQSWFRSTQIARPQNVARNLNVALMASVIAVLLIACFNISNLQLARGLSRARELAVRTALGAGRRDVVRLLVLESAIIAVVGAAGGTLLSLWGMGFIRSAMPSSVRGIGFVDPQVSWHLFAYALAATAITVLVAGLVPALRVTGGNLDEVLKSGAGTRTSRKSRQQYGVLIAAQVAGALALFAGSTLLFNAARNVHDLDFGYDSRNLVSMYGTFVRVSQAASSLDAMRPTLEALRADPSVVAAAGSTQGFYDGNAVMVDDPTRPRSEHPMPFQSFWVVTGDYLRALGLPVLRGADFTPGDIGATPSVIVDSIAAAKWWPGVNPVGRMIKLGNSTSGRPWVRVIGVARHARYQAYDTEADTKPQVYLLAQTLDSERNGTFTMAWLRGVVRVRANPQGAAVDLQRRFRSYGVTSAATWDQASGFDTLRISHDFLAVVFVAFAGLGMLLALMGIYGVVAHSVAQRTREFGVRFALGANTRDVTFMVLREGNVIILLGLAGGIILSNWGSRLVDAFLFHVDASGQMIVLSTTPVLTFLAATLATLLPALRAARVNPVEALRNE
jgi:predicted permease